MQAGHRGTGKKIETNREWAELTTQHYKVTLKRFFKWLKGVEGPGIYPDEVSWIRTTVKQSNNTLPEDILTEDEIRRLSEVATNPRDKALVQVFYESEARACELLTMKIKQVSFDENGAVIMVQGKTGARRIRLIP